MTALLSPVDVLSAQVIPSDIKLRGFRIVTMQGIVSISVSVIVDTHSTCDTYTNEKKQQSKNRCVKLL